MSNATARVLPSIVLLLACAAHADAAGVLVPRDGSPPIRVRSQRVTAIVADGLARTTLRQTFVNPQPRALEAIYLFPVPDGAALADLALEVGGQRLEGFLADRRTARRAYDAVVRTGRDPALVEQIGRSTFRMSVFPVLPDVPTIVEITWIEAAPRVAGQVRYVYPLALALDAEAPTITQRDLTVAVTIRSSAVITSLESPTQSMATRLASPHEGHASLELSQASLSQDVVVIARMAVVEPTLAVHTFRAPRGDAFFAAVVTPPDLADDQVLARDVTLVLDVSGSMKGEKFTQSKRAALWLLDHLRPRDRVNILTFSDVVRRAAPQPRPATAETLEHLRCFVEDAVAEGGTALGDAVRAACETQTEPGRVAVVVLLTDGLPTVGDTSTDSIVKHARSGGERGLRLFAFGVGADVDAVLLDGISSAAGGSAEVFRPEGEVESRLITFLARTESPALTNLVLTIGGRPIDDLLPRPLPDVHLGEQVVLTGRVAVEGSHEFRLTCTAGDRQVVLATTVDLGRSGASSGDPVARDHFARQRLAFLERAHRLRLGLTDAAYFAALDRSASATPDELVAAQIDASIATGVQCPHTSFLALLPEDRRRLDPRDAAALDAALAAATARKRELAGGESGSNDMVKDGDGQVELAAEAETTAVVSRGGAGFVMGGGRGPTTPGGGGPQSGGGARGPVSSGGGGGQKKITSNGGFEQWQFWWENNKDPYLDLKSRLEPGVRTVCSAGVLMAKRVHDIPPSNRPTWDEVAHQILPVLKEVLDHADADIVDSAVLALGRVTPADQSALVFDDVTRVLGNQNATPRQAAVLSLGILGSEDAVALLLEILNDAPAGRSAMNASAGIPDIQRSFSAISLGYIGNQQSIPAVLEVVRGNSNVEVRASAVLALGLFNDGKDEIVSELVKLLDDATLDPTLRAQIPITLGRLGAPAVGALPLIHELLRNEKTDPRVRQSAAIALGKLALPKDTDVIESLERYIDEGGDDQTRHFSVIALAYIAGKAAEDPDANALLIQGITDFLVKEHSGQGKSKKITHRPWAALSLALIAERFNENASERLSIVTRLIDAFDAENNPSYQSANAIGLGLLDAKPAGQKILKVLEESSDVSLRGYCAVALGMMRFTDAKDPLRQLVMDDRDPRLRLQVATALGLMGDTEVVPTLVDALRGAKTLGVISSIARALGLIGDRRAIEPLQAIIRDKKAPGLARAFACVALGLIAEKFSLPWNAPLSVDANYRTVIGAQYEILDIL